MGLNRFAKKRDGCERQIIAALQSAGWVVFQIDRPADLLCWRAGVWRVIECKDLDGRGRKLTAGQLADHSLLPPGTIPVVVNVDEALAI